jgi:hypothetical protein
LLQACRYLTLGFPELGFHHERSSKIVRNIRLGTPMVLQDSQGPRWRGNIFLGLTVPEVRKIAAKYSGLH